jgi:uncharacterized protein (TIGR02246 family)
MIFSKQTFRRIACCVALAPVLCIPAGLHAQASASSGGAPDQLRTLSRDELDVIKVLTRQENAWNGGDLASFATSFKDSPETLFVGSHISHGYADIIDDYKHNYPNKESMGTLSYSDLEPRVLDEHYAIVVGRYKLDRSKKAGGNAEGVFSLVLERTKDGWKIIVDHTTG